MAATETRALEPFLLSCQERVNLNLEQLLAADGASPRLQEAMGYACLGGGKRLRPLLAYAGTLAVGGELASADAAASAVELIHCYSLVHDDLPAMDDDDLRRGKPSLHKAYDEATAILVGDALQSLAFQVISTPRSDLAPATQLRMIQVLAEAAGGAGMAAGQALDFEATGKALDQAALQTMHSLKTGALIRASVLLGALSHATTTAEQLEALADFADKLGLAFQIRDDVLDVSSDTATLGKPQGSDQDRGQPTYVSLLGLEGARQLAGELAQQARVALADFPAAADRLRDIATLVVSRRS